ncbi:hypothetical protein A5742_27440 [Mycolicibacterium fortuitum]|uniref:Uncharacterized protein n=1 Tax=Mycolicibacterium fortuitum TaxID=1766 RepID=A0ABD6QM76_MYCFO|nr:hypothetical protein A5742_27440 [Mycolicibacterium fortuitum]
MLASRADVAAALGLADADSLSESQQARVDALLERVSGSVSREANRDFTPGAVQVRVLVIDGRIYLPDAESVTTVTDVDGAELDCDADVPGWFVVSRNGCRLLTGDPVVVDFVRVDVPAAVSGLVAGIAARHLSVEPGSPESMATDITAGADFRLRMADHVSSTALLTADEECEARGFRSKLPNVIVHRL